MGEYLLVVIDAYSRFPEVDIVHSTSAKTTINKLARIFAMHGIPRNLRSDNGPPFTSHDFKTFMEEQGIRHQRTTPNWPQANAEAERFMKPLKVHYRVFLFDKWLILYETIPMIPILWGFGPRWGSYKRAKWPKNQLCVGVSGLPVEKSESRP